MSFNGFTITLADQTIWFLWAVAYGFVVMPLYTFLRAGICKIKSRGVTATADILFFLVIAVLEFVFTSVLPMNTLRWFHIAGQFMGAALYWVTLAPVLSKFFSFFYSGILNFIKALFYFLTALIKREKKETE